MRPDPTGEHPRVLPMGERALLVEGPSLAWVLAATEALRDRLEALDVVPAARTVLVTAASRAELARLRDRVHEIITDLAPAEIHSLDSPVEIRVNYDGPDLAEVARLTALTEAEVVAAHTGTPWQVAFVGFAPGFPYLTGGDPRLTVPRRETPRTRVPAGAVGLAGEMSGIYPRPSPGGWQLIGSTDAPLWDLARTPPALLPPGTRVRFVEDAP